MAVSHINQSNFYSVNENAGVALQELCPRLYPPGVYLTRREAECFYLLSRFTTIKKIAKILSLSPRTIETYINQIKSKMGVLYKAELIEQAIELVSKDFSTEPLLNQSDGMITTTALKFLATDWCPIQSSDQQANY